MHCTVLYCTVLVDLSLLMLATCVLGAWHCLCWLEQCPGWGLSTLATSVQGAVGLGDLCEHEGGGGQGEVTLQ